MSSYHINAHHGYFLNPGFCERYWVPFFKDGKVVEGADSPEPPPFWIRLVSVFRLKYLSLIVFATLSMAFLLPAADLYLSSLATSRATSTTVAEQLPASRSTESQDDIIDPSSPGASIRKVLIAHGDIVDIDVEPRDIWVLMAKPVPKGRMHLNGDGSLFPDSEMTIVHVISGTQVASNTFTVLPFQKRDQKNALLPDSIIFTHGGYVFCFINSLAGENGYSMHGGIYQFDPANLFVKSVDQVFDSENWGWYPQFVGDDLISTGQVKQHIKHWGSDGYYWVVGANEDRTKQIPRPIAELAYKSYQNQKSEGILPSAKALDVINRIVGLAVKDFSRP